MSVVSWSKEAIGGQGSLLQVRLRVLIAGGVNSLYGMSMGPFKKYVTVKTAIKD